MSIQICENILDWNNAVEELGGTLYHSWGWGEVRAARGWKAWRILERTEDGAPIAAVQVLQWRAPMLGGSICYAPRGIAARRKLATLELPGWLRTFARKQRAAVLRVDPDIAEDETGRIGEWEREGFRHLADEYAVWGGLPRTTMFIDTTLPDNQIMRRMRGVVRNQLRRVLSASIQINAGCEKEQLEGFYELLVRSANRQGFPIRSLAHFEHMNRHVLSSGRGTILLARYESKPVAAILCARFGKVCHDLHNGFDWEYRRLNLNPNLHWCATQWAKANGCEIYDLGGVPTKYPPQKGNPGYGVYDFKKALGAELRRSAGYFDLAQNKTAYAAFRALEKHAAGRAYRLLANLRSIRGAFRRFGDKRA